MDLQGDIEVLRGEVAGKRWGVEKGDQKGDGEGVTHIFGQMMN